MLDSDEQVHKCLPIQLPRAKYGSPGESDDKTDDNVPAATPSSSDSVASDPKVPFSSTRSLADQIHELTTRFDAYWDESEEHRVALSQDMDAIKAEMTSIRANQDLITQQRPSSSLFTPRHRHHHRSDSLGRISWPLLFFFLFVNEDTISFKFGGVCVGIWVGSELFCLF